MKPLAVKLARLLSLLDKWKMFLVKPISPEHRVKKKKLLTSEYSCNFYARERGKGSRVWFTTTGGCEVKATRLTAKVRHGYQVKTRKFGVAGIYKGE